MNNIAGYILGMLTGIAAMSVTHNACADSWSTPDKVAHAKMSTVLGLGATGAFQALHVPKASWKAWGVCVGAGAAKEVIHDHWMGKGEMSIKDFGADLAGCAVGSWLGNRVFVYPIWE